MNTRLGILFFAAAAVLAACGGGGSTTGGGGNPLPIPTTAPTTAPTSAPTSAPQGNLPLQQSVAGSMAWVDPSSHKTLYFLDVDTATGGTCTGACLGVWPVLKPTSGSKGNGNMSIITRSDGTGQQWAYQGHPLYTFSGDSGPAQANGDNFPEFGGHWHVARPVSATPPPGGGSTPQPCVGPYC